MAKSTAGTGSICPGCGLTLPARTPRRSLLSTPHPNAGASTGRSRRSDDRPVLVGFHQLTGDAYAAQHPRRGAPPITTASSLFGLRLALDRGLSGIRVRDAHQRLARGAGPWPAFCPPATLDALGQTILYVAVAGSHDDHRGALDRWARAVWAAWTNEHARVAALVSGPNAAPIRDLLTRPTPGS